MYNDFTPDDEENLGDEFDDGHKKFSIRALNFKMMSKIP